MLHIFYMLSTIILLSGVIPTHSFANVVEQKKNIFHGDAYIPIKIGEHSYSLTLSTYSSDTELFAVLKYTSHKNAEYIILDIQTPNVCTEEDKNLFKTLSQASIPTYRPSLKKLLFSQDLINSSQGKIYLCKPRSKKKTSFTHLCEGEEIFLGYRKNFTILNKNPSQGKPPHKTLVYYSFKKKYFTPKDVLNYIFPSQKQEHFNTLHTFYLKQKLPQKYTISKMHLKQGELKNTWEFKKLPHVPEKYFFYLLSSYDGIIFQLLNNLPISAGTLDLTPLACWLGSYYLTKVILKHNHKPPIHITLDPQITKIHQTKDNILRILTNTAAKYTNPTAIGEDIPKEPIFQESSSPPSADEAILNSPALEFWTILVKLDHLYGDQLTGPWPKEHYQKILRFIHHNKLEQHLTPPYTKEELEFFEIRYECAYKIYQLEQEKPPKRTAPLRESFSKLYLTLLGLSEFGINKVTSNVSDQENLNLVQDVLLLETSRASLADPTLPTPLDRKFFEDMTPLILLGGSNVIQIEILKRAWVLLWHAIHDKRYFTQEDTKNVIEFIASYHIHACPTGLILSVFQPLRGSKHPVAECFFILLTQQNVEQNIVAYFKALGQDALAKTLENLTLKQGYHYSKEEVSTAMKHSKQSLTEKELAFQKEFLHFLKQAITTHLKQEITANVRLDNILPLYHTTLETYLFPYIEFNNDWEPMLTQQFGI